MRVGVNIWELVWMYESWCKCIRVIDHTIKTKTNWSTIGLIINDISHFKDVYTTWFKWMHACLYFPTWWIQKNRYIFKFVMYFGLITSLLFFLRCAILLYITNRETQKVYRDCPGPRGWCEQCTQWWDARDSVCLRVCCWQWGHVP